MIGSHKAATWTLGCICLLLQTNCCPLSPTQEGMSSLRETLPSRPHFALPQAVGLEYSSTKCFLTFFHPHTWQLLPGLQPSHIWHIDNDLP